MAAASGEVVVVKEDPAAAATTSSDGELAGLQAGVDFGVATGLLRATGFDSSPDLGQVGSTGLRPRARARRIVGAGVGHDHGAGAPGPVGGGELASPSLPERPLLMGMEHIGVAGADTRAAVLAPAGRSAELHGPEQEPVGEAMRLAAITAMFGAAMALIGEPDASRRSQFRTLMFWLGGCLGLFLWILRRR